MAADTGTTRDDPGDADLGFASPPGPDIAAAARRIGHYVWVAARLYEITGEWATTTADPSDRIAFAGVAGSFAWQADEWRRRLPRLAEADVELLIRPPTSRAEAALEELAATPEPDRARALEDLVGRFDTVLARHGAAASPLRDGPLLRSIERIRAELAARITG